APLTCPGALVTLLGHDRLAVADAQPRPGPRARRLLRVSAGLAVAARGLSAHTSSTARAGCLPGPPNPPPGPPRRARAPTPRTPDEVSARGPAAQPDRTLEARPPPAGRPRRRRRPLRPRRRGRER